MRKKLAVLTASLIFGIVLTPVYAETVAVNNSPPKVSSVAASDPVGILLERAKYWESRNRIDLAKEALEKLFRRAPNHPDGLAEMGLIEARAEHLDSARNILNKLRGVKPDHPAIGRIEALIRLYGEDKNKLQQARLLAKTGHTKEALTAFRKLYPSGPPSNDLALEYWQLVADTDGGWSSARDGLAKLVRENPEDLRYRLALAEHEISRLPLKMQALQVIIDMAKLPEYSRQARKSWRRALMRLENSPANLPLLSEYLAAEPNDSAVKERQQSIIQSEETRRRLMADQNYRAKVKGISLLDKMDLAAAEPLLEQALRAHPKDADVVGEMGLLRMRQGKHAQAHELFTQALHLTQGKSGKWKSLIKTSQFWQLMRASRDARDAGDLTLAENKLYAALQLDSKEPNAIATLARIQADRGKFKEAEDTYRQALSIEPLNDSALNGLLSLYRQQGREVKVRQMIANLSPEQRSALGTSLNRMEADMLQQQADRLLAEGRHDEAIALLEQAIQLDADDPWLRFNLAKQYAHRNSPEKGLALFDDFLAKHPNDPDALYARAQYQANLDDTDNALATLAQVDPARRSEKISLLQQRLRITKLRQQAKLLAQSGRQNDAKQALSEAEAVSSGNEEFTLAVALAWAEIGDTRHGRALFDNARTAQPSINWHLRYAEFLAMIGSDQELRDELESIAGIRELPPSDAETLAELRESAAIRMADKQTLAGNATLAHQTLAPFLKAKPDQVRLLLVDARAYRAERQWSAALGVYAHVLQLDRIDREARSGLIETLVASDKRAIALQNLNEWTASSTANDFPTRLHLSGLFIDLKEYARAQELIDPLLASHPNHPLVLDYAWQIAQHAGRLDQEIDYLKRSLAAEQAEHNLASPLRAPAQNEAQPMPKTAYENIGIDEFGDPKKIQRDWKEKKLAALIDRRSDWAASAVDVRYRSGTAGLSEFHSVEIPLEYKTTWHADDEVFFRTDLIKLNAGNVDFTNNSFGGLMPNTNSMIAQSAQQITLNTGLNNVLTDPKLAPDIQAFCRLHPICTQTMQQIQQVVSSTSQQSTKGMSFTAGYQRDDLSADIGFTPLDFPVTNVVGGVSKKGDLGQYGYSIEASRRPITSSLLSFAGTREPVTGWTWGGVVATGARIGLSLDKGEAFGFWSSAGLHRLTGTNVLSNSRLQLMAGGQWRIVNEENRLFSLGLTGMYWHHTQNAGEYTFGHGGYYSPLNYRSLSLPITYAERSPRFSYMLRAAISASQSQMRDAPYFPTDSTMQTLATDIYNNASAIKALLPALSSTYFPNPTYSSGSSHGTGQSLKAAWEYQLEPKLFVGGSLSIDRSESYAPNRLLFYMRYSLDHPAAQPVFMPPEPIEPSSQF